MSGGRRFRFSQLKDKPRNAYLSTVKEERRCGHPGRVASRGVTVSLKSPTSLFATQSTKILPRRTPAHGLRLTPAKHSPNLCPTAAQRLGREQQQKPSLPRTLLVLAAARALGPPHRFPTVGPPTLGRLNRADGPRDENLEGDCRHRPMQHEQPMREIPG